MPNSNNNPDVSLNSHNNHKERIVSFLAGQIGITERPDDEDLNRYQLAFTHGSATGGEESYERLEFLGDRVLNHIVAKYLFEHEWEGFPDGLSPGQMTVMMGCVQNTNLSTFVETKFPELEDLIIKQEEQELTKKMRADIFEAFIGAVYRHKKFDATEKIVLNIFEEEIKTFENQNFIGSLKEACEAEEHHFLFRQTGEEGSDNGKPFHFQVTIDGKVMGEGTGQSKPEAKQQAAKIALEKWRTSLNNDN